MKSRFLSSVVLGAFLLLLSQNGFAQRKSVKQLYKKAAEAAREQPAVKVKLSAKEAAARMDRAKKAAPRALHAPDAPSLEALRRSMNELEILNARLLEQKNYLEGMRKTKEAVFQAVPLSSYPTNTYSGAVFETSYQGKKEIFGVISTHALGSFYAPAGFLYKEFQASFQVDGETRLLPATVVQISSRKMTDMALVKFRPEDETFLRPLALAAEAPDETELYSQGFACGLPLTVPARQILGTTSELVIKTTMPVDKEGRAGLCGSAVLNRRHELVGIHTGSSYHPDAPAADVGYVAPVQFLRRLVAAYHNDGRALLPVRLKGRSVAAINVDEYISKVELLDADGNVLWERETGAKFAPGEVERQMDLFTRTRFVRLHAARSVWEEEHGVFVLKDGGVSSEKIFLYDMIKKKSVPVRRD